MPPVRVVRRQFHHPHAPFFGSLLEETDAREQLDSQGLDLRLRLQLVVGDPVLGALVLGARGHDVGVPSVATKGVALDAGVRSPDPTTQHEIGALLLVVDHR